MPARSKKRSPVWVSGKESESKSLVGKSLVAVGQSIQARGQNFGRCRGGKRTRDCPRGQQDSNTSMLVYSPVRRPEAKQRMPLSTTPRAGTDLRLVQRFGPASDDTKAIVMDVCTVDLERHLVLNFGRRDPYPKAKSAITDYVEQLCHKPDPMDIYDMMYPASEEHDGEWEYVQAIEYAKGKAKGAGRYTGQGWQARGKTVRQERDRNGMATGSWLVPIQVPQLLRNFSRAGVYLHPRRCLHSEPAAEGQERRRRHERPDVSTTPTARLNI